MGFEVFEERDIDGGGDVPEAWACGVGGGVVEVGTADPDDFVFFGAGAVEGEFAGEGEFGSDVGVVVGGADDLAVGVEAYFTEERLVEVSG